MTGVQTVHPKDSGERDLRIITGNGYADPFVRGCEKLAATGWMAATIAHEINNPLESVINLMFLARQYSVGDSRYRSISPLAKEELERVCHIARQTLGYYKDTTSPTPVHLHDLIHNVLAVYNSKMLGSRISGDTQFNDLQKITVSKGELLQVLSNVIANAIDAMRQTRCRFPLGSGVAPPATGFRL